MRINRYYLYYKTQTPNFLFFAVLFIIALGILISSVVNYSYQKDRQDRTALLGLYNLNLRDLNSEKYTVEFQKFIDTPNIDWEEFLHYIESISIFGNPQTINISAELLEQKKSENNAFATIATFLRAIQTDSYIELELLTKQKPPPNYANRLLAFLYQNQQMIEPALTCLYTEPTLSQSKACQQRLVLILLNSDKIEDLKKLANDPTYAEFHYEIESKIQSIEKNWIKIFLNIIHSQVDIKINGIFLLTIMTGIVWFGIWLHALRPSKVASTIVLSLFAFLLGVFSTTLTLFAIYLERSFFPMSMGKTILEGLLYFVFSVGLREEFLKALVFLPLIPILLKRRNTIEWLIIPGMVGLGFAIEENLNYFLETNGSSVPGRFLTANFFHVGLTALVGESLCYYFYDRSRGVTHFLSTFAMAVLMHGIYDAFIAVPQLAQLNIISSITFIYIAFQFFGRLRRLRDNSIEPISLSTHFIIAVTVLFMCVFGYFSFDGGHLHAAKTLASTFIDLSITIYMFLYIMPNSIIKA